ncbi:hypothetical protein [Streptomyces nogalater]|uniref:Uncharacterized protein n=1 Tax=Streptomyces nogalater TaxID=38314 RepID=A0ABW0WAZ1_STRNO
MDTTETFEPVDSANVHKGDRVRFVTANNGFGGGDNVWRTGTVTKVTEKTVRVECDSNAFGSTAVLRRNLAAWKARCVTKAATGQPADKPDNTDEELPATVVEAATGIIVITKDGDRPQYDVWLDQKHIGTIFDETGANLARGGFAAWSPKAQRKDGIVGFYATKEEAGDAIGRLHRPVGPRGMTEPRNRSDSLSFHALPADRQAAVTAHAARLHAEGGRTAARCWRDALDADWREHLEIPDEDTLRMCVAVMGGEIHTVAPGSDDTHVYPLCRTGGQNNRLTKYRFVDGADLTCQHCVGYREGRAAARARKAART